jgi:Putative peptidoglycan binding domain
MSTLPAVLTSPRFQGKRFSDAYKNTPTIKKGEKGEHVRRLQQALIDLRMTLKGATAKYGTPHGKFDTELHEAVFRFQSRELPSEVPDGKVGTKTLARLNALLPGPGAELPPLPKGEADDVDTIVANQIGAVLRDSIAAKLGFWFREFHITGAGLRQIGDMVVAGKIAVIVDPSLGPNARGAYQMDNEDVSGANRFVMPKPAATGWKDRSYIVHEGIHALQDLRKMPATTKVSEAAAYVGQAMYYRLATGKALTVSGLGKTIFEAADYVATKLLAKLNVEAAQVQPLYNAIGVIYSGVPNPDYDGIPG